MTITLIPEKCLSRVVIKIGSALLIDNTTNQVRGDWLTTLKEDILALRSSGTDVVIVSSGAIALGQNTLGLKTRPTRLEDAQAAAAIGQIKLAEAFGALFASADIAVAQVLLTLHDLEDRGRYLNARNTLDALVDKGIIPIVNENDTVATEEIRFGDNDRLAARVAQLVKADATVLLSDVEGLYTKDPNQNSDAELLETVDAITPAIEAMAGPAKRGSVGTGGMATKIDAAKIATAAGCALIITNGTGDHPLKAFGESRNGTVFTASAEPLAVRKAWIRGMMSPSGFLHIDDGAEAALKRGASLLPAGVTSIDGNFIRGDLVALMNASGKVIGQGLSGYSDEEAELMAGHNSKEATERLGYAVRHVMVHRDDLILF